MMIFVTGVVLIFSSIAALLLNSFVIGASAMLPRPLSSSAILMLTLSVMDIITAVFIMSYYGLKMVGLGGAHASLICSILSHFEVYTLDVSFLINALIGFDRYLSFHKPIAYRGTYIKKWIIKGLLSACFFPLLMDLLLWAYFYHNGATSTEWSNLTGRCEFINDSDYSDKQQRVFQQEIYMLILEYIVFQCLPFVGVVYAYSSICYSLWFKKTLTASWKIIKNTVITFGLITLVFMLTWIPSAYLTIKRAELIREKGISIKSSVGLCANVIFLSTITNPLIYTLRHKKLKAVVVKKVKLIINKDCDRSEYRLPSISREPTFIVVGVV